MPCAGTAPPPGRRRPGPLSLLLALAHPVLAHDVPTLAHAAPVIAAPVAAAAALAIAVVVVAVLVVPLVLLVLVAPTVGKTPSAVLDGPRDQRHQHGDGG